MVRALYSPSMAFDTPSPALPAPAAVAAEPASRHAPLSMAGFVAVMAALMALNALAVDIMLPGLPNIAVSFGIADTTAVQPIITAYLLGFGIGQLFMGVLSDRFGRKPVLLFGLVAYVVAAGACAVAPSLEALLLARFVQGVGSSAPRVIATAAIRDCYAGRRMARVMSLTMMVFMGAPIVAPAIGQGVLFLGDWHWVFALLVAYGIALFAICALRLPETLDPENRRPIEAGTIVAGLAAIFGNRQTLGYMLAAGSFFGALFGFVNSAQQVMVDVFGLGVWFPAVFALIAFSLGFSAFLNANLVERFGMRLLSHVAVCIFTLLAFTMVALDEAGLLDVWTFVPLMTLNMMLVGMIFSNFNALAMAPQGRLAGIASSVIGAVCTLMGAGIGFAIGQAFDGSVGPLALGYGLSGTATLLLLLITERGRLFQPGNQG